MTKEEREVMRMALEALETHADIGIKSNKAITAIKEALMSVPDGAQPEQEPVAWVHHLTFKNLNSFERSRYSTTLAKKQTDACCIPLYTNPPQRKPLTDEEIILIVAECAASHQHTDIHFARAIERAHGIKEKNT